MFLFSGGGYWQELIESIVWAQQVKSIQLFNLVQATHKVVLLVLLTTYSVVLQQLGLSLKLELFQLVKLSFN
jgi:hypothetical protein